MNLAEDRDTCPRCGKAFHCGAADARCDCFDMALGAPLRQAIAQHYERCLCIDCLKALTEGTPIAPAALPWPQRNAWPSEGLKIDWHDFSKLALAPSCVSATLAGVVLRRENSFAQYKVLTMQIPARDGDGYLLDMNEWTPEIGRAMAQADGYELDDRKWEQILKAREYYEEFSSVPPIRKFAKYINEDQKEIFSLWMTGPMKPITKYGGMPKPTGCV